MANKRVFYACQAVAFADYDEATDTIGQSRTVAHGVQSVGVTTNFNLEQVFELGQLQIYENIEGVPDVEVTVEKVFDGYPLLIELATPTATGNGSTSLIGRSKERCAVGLVITDDETASAGIANAYVEEVLMKGMYLSSLSYNLPVEGNCTESITLVGNDKRFVGINTFQQAVQQLPNNGTDGTDIPQNLTAGGVQRRENVDVPNSSWPTSLPGVDNSGFATGDIHIQNVSISTDFSREDIFELGRKAPYYRAPNFPIEVTCDIEIISVSSDRVEAFEEGNPVFNGTANEGNNTVEETILVYLQQGTVFDLGSKNRLSSITYGGGDATGGNASVTYSFTNFNDLEVL